MNAIVNGDDRWQELWKPERQKALRSPKQSERTLRNEAVRLQKIPREPPASMGYLVPNSSRFGKAHCLVRK